jgi:hypothetical protein
MYVFPGDNSTVFIMNVNSNVTGEQSEPSFLPGARCEFKVHLDGALDEGITYRVSFDPPAADGRQNLQLRALTGAEAADDTAAGELVLEGRTGEAVHGAVTNLWAGRIGDWFYIDLALLDMVNGAVRAGSALDLSAWHPETAKNSFANTTVDSIVLEVSHRHPQLQPGTPIAVWYATKISEAADDWHQINRFGHPMIWPIFWPDDVRFTHPANSRHPSEDYAADGKTISELIASTVAATGASGDPSGYGRAVARELFPDVMSYVVGTPAVYGFAIRNGRSLADNAPEVMLSLVTNTAVPSGLKPSVSQHLRPRGDRVSRRRSPAAQDLGGAGHGAHLAGRRLPRNVFHPAVRGDHDLLRRDMGQRPAYALDDRIDGLDGRVGQVDHAHHDRLSGEVFQYRCVEIGLCRLDRDLVAAAIGEFRQKGVARRTFVDDRGVAETQMYRRGADHTGQCAIEGLHAVHASGLRSRLKIGLVQLDDVGASREEVTHLGVDGVGIGVRKVFRISVVIVLSLLRHGEGTRHRDLDRAVGVFAQEANIGHLNRPRPAHRAHHAGDGVRMSAAVQRLAWVVQIEPHQGGREVIRVALPPDLTVGQDVQAGILLRPDREQRGVVLRAGEVLRRRPPQFRRSDARRKPAGELSPVDQPLGLRKAAHECGREQRKCRHDIVLQGSPLVSPADRECGSCRCLRQCL